MKTKEFHRQSHSAQFTYREGRNDYYVVLSAFEGDEYGLEELGLRPGDIAIDIGAHLGAVTMLMAFMGAEVYAYEAVRENYELLLANVVQNKTEGHVNPHLRAVCGTNEPQTIYLGWVRDQVHHYIGNLYSNTETAQVVAGITLDKIFSDNAIERCAILKLDVEGAEWEILAAASDDTLSRIDYMVGEYHTVSGPPGTRAALLEMTRGFFEDITDHPDLGGLSAFRFARRQA
uniref:Putative methyltransferase n=1 Tax=viral metagenome TaxID=1070528 RepID=A0A6H1ZDZ0_9ZZZZ